MSSHEPGHWRRAVVTLALVYLGVGLLFGELASGAASEQALVAYRRAAWLVSGVAFVGQVVYERRRRGSKPSVAARRAACAAAMGASALAAAALVRALVTGGGRPGRLALALIVWPTLTAAPAFLVAIALGYVLPSGDRVARR